MAIKIKASHKGLFTRKARKAGKSVAAYAREKKNAPGALGKEARFALAAKHWSHKGRKRTRKHAGRKG